MYKVVYTGSFKKDIKRCQKRNLDFSLLKKAVVLLEKNGELPEKYVPHKLTGSYKGFWECHIKPDWLLIWEIDKKTNTLYFVRTGTHSDLF